jgi:hypothetical protein
LSNNQKTKNLLEGMKDKAYYIEGMRNDRHQDVISRQYSPQEIENSNVEILHNVPKKTALTLNKQISMYRSRLP